MFNVSGNNYRENKTVQIATKVSPNTNDMIEEILSLGIELSKGELARAAIGEYLRRHYTEIYNKFVGKENALQDTR